MKRHLLIIYGLLGLLWFMQLKTGFQSIDGITAAPPDASAVSPGADVDQIINHGRRIPASPAVLIKNGTRIGQKCRRGQFMTGIDADAKIECTALRAEDVARTAVECNGHGFIQDGFCRCNENWVGEECENPRPARDPNALPDEDHDNWTSPPDCDDTDDLVYPGAPDSVDGKDNDCDGEVDEGY